MPYEPVAEQVPGLTMDLPTAHELNRQAVMWSYNIGKSYKDLRDRRFNTIFAVTQYHSLPANAEPGTILRGGADYPPEPTAGPLPELCTCRADMVGGEVKSHDYAFDTRPSIKALRVPEVWVSAIDDLMLHDHYIRVYPPVADRYRLSGKKLYHLLDLGWVTPQEASQNWRREDWEAVTSYEWRTDGPYPVCIPKWLKKPNLETRNRIRVLMFNPMEEDVPESHIFISGIEAPFLGS